MNWLDVAVVVGLAAFALRGFLKGLVTESLGFLGLLVAAAASLYANPQAADILRRGLGISRPLAAFAAAILCFLVVEFVWHLGLWFLLGRGEKASFRKSSANWMGGALFGLGKGVIVASLALVALSAVPMPEAYRTAAEGAEVAGTVRAVAPWIGARVTGMLPRAARQRYDAFRREVAQLGSQWHIIAPRRIGPAPSASPAVGAGGAKAPPAKPRPQ
ncbi:MAG TPA: CvpA family protein [Candidatus Sulfotelmatobacter sp.]|nr:CvpA family protein [Candidatus Sulfotelmatobacter sp.]